MDYAHEIESLKLFLDAEKATTRRLRELLKKANEDKDKYIDRIYVLQDENDDLKEALDKKEY